MYCVPMIHKIKHFFHYIHKKERDLKKGMGRYIPKCEPEIL
jgi:hypothetical protein